MIVNESINNYPQKVQIVRNDTGEQIYESGAITVGSKIERAKLDAALPAGMQRQQVCDTLEITLYGSGIEDQSLTYRLNAAEKEVLREKMEAYCMQREHKPLEQLCQEILQEQDAPTQEMQL